MGKKHVYICQRRLRQWWFTTLKFHTHIHTAVVYNVYLCAGFNSWKSFYRQTKSRKSIHFCSRHRMFATLNQQCDIWNFVVQCSFYEFLINLTWAASVPLNACTAIFWRSKRICRKGNACQRLRRNKHIVKQTTSNENGAKTTKAKTFALWTLNSLIWPFSVIVVAFVVIGFN